MGLEDFPEKLPLISKWIDDTLAQHAANARTASSYGFSRLPKFYTAEFLTRAKVVVVDHVPIPPLVEMGLPELADFLSFESIGITYRDTYFLRTSEAENESVHFHELVHVVQWTHLGVERFLLAYAAGLLGYGYRNSPLEQMAYGLQEYFDRNGTPGNAETFIRGKLDEMRIP